MRGLQADAIGELGVLHGGCQPLDAWRAVPWIVVEPKHSAGGARHKREPKRKPSW